MDSAAFTKKFDQKLSIPKIKKFVLKHKVLSDFFNPISGIYFLFDHDEVVYVGRSNDIIQRIFSHRKTKQFTHHFILPLKFETEDEESLESALILHFTPRYNGGLPGGFFQKLSRVARDYREKGINISVYDLKGLAKQGTLKLFYYNGSVYVDTRQLQNVMGE